MVYRNLAQYLSHAISFQFLPRRLVSRMTTGEREDKRRESAELHNVFVEQVGRDSCRQLYISLFVAHLATCDMFHLFNAVKFA